MGKKFIIIAQSKNSATPNTGWASQEKETKGRKTFVLCYIFLFLFLSVPIISAQPSCSLERKVKPKKVASLESFKGLPILHQGRVKPLDTYARSLLLQFSGRRSYNRKPAIEWLAALVFAPKTVWNDKVFLINNPQIPMALGIKPEKKRHYSFNQLNQRYSKFEELARAADQVEEKERTIVEQEILRVYYNVSLFLQHNNLSNFAFPHKDFQITDSRIIKRMGLSKQNGYSFLDIALKADVLQEATKYLDVNKMETWSDEDRTLFQLSNNLYKWSRHYQNLPFHVIPMVKRERNTWISPWDAIGDEFYDTRIRQEITLWRDLTVYYWNGEQLFFDTAVKALQISTMSRLEKKEREGIRKIPSELLYNKGNFLLWAKLFYGLAFLVFLFSLFIPSSWLHLMSFICIVLGIIPHIIAFALRIVIMGRPPVTNLFETFAFVSLMSVIIGLIIEIRNKQWVGIVVSSVCGFVFLMISGKYAAEGDTMQMLVAVLNSNFWLTTHVISITIGYAGCCVAGIIGHMYLLQSLSKNFSKKFLNSVYRNLVGTLTFGLFMSFLGTFLGGIWADQSWGRFWGWDPKENGALLIVIWCALILHAKVGRLIGPVGVAVGAVLGNIVVMWAWFGVNLLNIGLHSYGFTFGIAKNLLIYVLAEIIFLISIVPLIKKKIKS